MIKAVCFKSHADKRHRAFNGFRVDIIQFQIAKRLGIARDARQNLTVILNNVPALRRLILIGETDRITLFVPKALLAFAIEVFPRHQPVGKILLHPVKRAVLIEVERFVKRQLLKFLRGDPTINGQRRRRVQA